jgi:hypothetical protein
LKEEDFDEDDDLDWLDPNMALPDNLTFIDKTVLPKSDKGGRDWGTGIAQKTFRVGSPTFFSNPNINIPGMMDDLDGYSCTDSEDEEVRVEQVHVDKVSISFLFFFCKLPPCGQFLTTWFAPRGKVCT